MVATCDDLEVYVQLYDEEKDPALLEEFSTQLDDFLAKVEEWEIRIVLSDKYDTFPCFFGINAGAGGTDAQDWAQLLYRMYVRWFEKRGFQYEVLDYTEGEEAGLKSAMLAVSGEFAYGYLKNEAGVHRLVRLSPFNANSKRQTSFAAVDVTPKLDLGAIDLQIDPKELKIDTYRSSGAGGQHVNKTDSAVRITHLPTGIVATSQASRSQIDNRETAMSLLKSRILVVLERERKEQLQELRGNVTEIAWGNQIRSYVFHPYKLVKDLRTDYETSDVQGVMDGDLDPFINAKLKMLSRGTN